MDSNLPHGFPKKEQEFQNHHMDSTVWNYFKPRDDDIVICSYAKAGTTWTQQIVSQLIFNGEEGVPIHTMSPWLDLRISPNDVMLAAVEAQTHRRFIKTHLPAKALVVFPQVKYIYIARDGRDVLWSLYNHHCVFNDAGYKILNDTTDAPSRVGPPFPRPGNDIKKYFHEWLEKDGYPYWPFWENVQSWWNIRHLPNALFLHFACLKADMPKEIRRIAKFLNISIDESKWPAIFEHCSFEYMKNHGDMVVPAGGFFFDGADNFLFKGTNGRWLQTLTEAECKEYEDIAIKKLGPECANWLATGNWPEGDPFQKPNT